MFLLPPPEVVRREIAVGERLLLTSPRMSYESFVANDGRLRLRGGERVPAVRRTLAELLAALPSLVAIRRLPTSNAGILILPMGNVLRIADGTPLLDALRGLPAVESVTILDTQDRSFSVPRAAFGGRRLDAGDALILGKEARSSQVSVVGGVKRPGVYEIIGTTTLADAILLAGGLSQRALVEKVLIERERKPLGPFTLPRDGATPIRPGDVIRVPVSEAVAYVSVAGAVKRPGLIEIVTEMSVAQAIEAAGGLTLPVGGLNVVLRSVTDPKRRTIRGRASDLTKFPTLKGGDILEIAPPPSPRKPGATQ